MQLYECSIRLGFDARRVYECNLPTLAFPSVRRKTDLTLFGSFIGGVEICDQSQSLCQRNITTNKIERLQAKGLTFTPFATCAAKLMALPRLVRPLTWMCSIVCIALSFCSSSTFSMGTSV